MKMPSLDHRNKLMSPVRHKQPAQLTSGAGSPVTPAAIRRVSRCIDILVAIDSHKIDFDDHTGT